MGLLILLYELLIETDIVYSYVEIYKKNYFFSHSMVCDDNLLLYLHGIYYNMIRQDPNHDTYFNLTDILKEK
jgi:hypothetical protein